MIRALALASCLFASTAFGATTLIDDAVQDITAAKTFGPSKLCVLKSISGKVCLYFTGSGDSGLDLGNLPVGEGGGGAVDSVNARTGAVTIVSGDITDALTYTPARDPLRCTTGTISGSLTLGSAIVGTCDAVGVTVGMRVTATPAIDPGVAICTAWATAGTLHVKLCGVSSTTINSTVFYMSASP